MEVNGIKLGELNKKKKKCNKDISNITYNNHDKKIYWVNKYSYLPKNYLWSGQLFLEMTWINIKANIIINPIFKKFTIDTKVAILVVKVLTLQILSLKCVLCIYH